MLSKYNLTTTTSCGLALIRPICAYSQLGLIITNKPLTGSFASSRKSLASILGNSLANLINLKSHLTIG